MMKMSFTFPKFTVTACVSLFFTSALFCLGASGCGYGFQNSHSELLEKEGIHRIYISPLANNTYKPGIETVVYNALVRTILAHRRVSIVRSDKEADAVLSGAVTTAQFTVAAAPPAYTIGPQGLSSDLSKLNQASDGPFSKITVATVYSANLACSFSLIRKNPPPGKRTGSIWGGGFSKSQAFPSANQLDIPGTTSALINESEFDRALSDIAVSMMEDLHESMLAMF